MWSMLDQLTNDHYEDLKKCDLHLCYIGCGLFIEIIMQEKPLEFSHDSMDKVQSLIVGDLTAMEEQSLTLGLTASFGVGFAREDSQTSAECLKTGKKAETKSSAPALTKQVLSPDLTSKEWGTPQKHIKMIFKKLNISVNDSVKLSQELLDSIPTSRYVAEPADLSLAKMSNTDDIKGHSSSDETVVYLSSDETVAYWPPDDKNQSGVFAGIAHQSVPEATEKNKDKKECISRQPKEVKQNRTFKLSVHEIR